jgi:hypothetical protein
VRQSPADHCGPSVCGQEECRCRPEPKRRALPVRQHSTQGR